MLVILKHFAELRLIYCHIVESSIYRIATWRRANHKLKLYDHYLRTVTTMSDSEAEKSVLIALLLK